ncbi:uncharacterized protein LOC125382143 [Haliotis rufescens]|uniref:uncharacterized protein LOC125382143 n=1 Tax=Haliotis rufescens TaxID=6454 RepID=UPI00201F8F2B|nr:uncharacterized protein LOC125382143 [Haliotis rufescens]
MTAKEWKNWVLVFSLLCLDGLLPTIHLKVWQTFVLACKHFCQPCIEKVNLVIAKNLMVKFCTQVTQLYGAQFITPNMHLHCHLHESVRNFGSMYGFWLFSFERYNGIMSDFHTNKKNIEEQLMKKFLMFSTTTEENLDTEFHSHLKRLSYSSISPIQLTSSGLLTLPTSMITDIKTDCWSDLTHITFRHTVGSPVSVVGKEFHYNLCKVYSYMYRREVSVDNVSGVCTKYSSVHFKNESLGSVSNKQPDRNSHVFASWADDDTNFSDSLTPRLGKIRHFVHNVIELAVGEPVEHVFAYIDWFKTPSDQFGYLNPVSVWSTKLQNDGPASFLPIQRICGKAAWRHEMHNSQ